MANIFAFIPAFGKMISAATFETSHHLAMAMLQKGHTINIGTYSWPDIADMRNMMLSYWYDMMPNSDYLLFIDADMGFSPQVVLDMMAFGEPVVGAVYPKRTYPIEWAVSGVPDPEKRGEFWEVEGLGAGCLLIRRDAITKMIETYPDLIGDYMQLHDLAASGAKRTFRFFDRLLTEKGLAAEDISFCRLWRSAGGKVWGAVGHDITHVGQHPFTAGFLSHAAQVERMKADNALLTSDPAGLAPKEAQRDAPTSLRKHILDGNDQSAA